MPLQSSRAVTLVLAAMLTTGCAWSPVQTSSEAEPKPLPDRVRVQTTSDSIFAVRAPTIRADSLRGHFRVVTRPPFMHETGPLVERAIPMSDVKKVTAYQITTGSFFAGLAGLATGFCLVPPPGMGVSRRAGGLVVSMLRREGGGVLAADPRPPYHSRPPPTTWSAMPFHSRLPDFIRRHGPPIQRSADAFCAMG